MSWSDLLMPAKRKVSFMRWRSEWVVALGSVTQARTCVGMLRDHPALIGVASGGGFSGERANQLDFLRPYLMLALNTIGLKTLQFLPHTGHRVY